jgi:hypothetical protein
VTARMADGRPAGTFLAPLTSKVTVKVASEQGGTMTAATDDVEARTASRPTSPTPAVATWVAYVGAAAFVFVTVANLPRFDPGMPLDAHLHRWFSWFVATLPQQRLDTGVAIAGFLCLVPLAGFARDLLGRDRVLARIGSLALPTGALLWVTGNLLQLGGHRAAGLMATHRNPIQTVNAVLFTVGTIDEAFKLAALAVLGVALLAFAGAAIGGPIGTRAVPRAWCGYSLLLGVVLLGLSGAYAAADGNLVGLLLGRRCPTDTSHLLAGGALLLPVWLLWTGRLLRTDDRSRHAS